MGRGETDSWKKPEAKNLVTLSHLDSFYSFTNFLINFQSKIQWGGKCEKTGKVWKYLSERISKIYNFPDYIKATVSRVN